MPEIKIKVGEILFGFSDEKDWVNNAKDKFERHNVKARHTICIDRIGRVCLTGKEFTRAERENTYPIFVYESVIE